MDYNALRHAISRLKAAAREREKPLLDLHGRAAGHAESGRLTEAEADYRSFLTENDANATWWYELAMVLVAQGRLEGAVEAFLKSLALDSSCAKRYYDLGTLLEQIGDSDSDSDSDSDASRYMRALPPADLFMVQHRVADAVNIYTAEYESNPGDLSVASTLASALQVLGEQGRAALVMGHANHRAGRHDQAIDELTNAIGIGSTDASAYAELAASLNANRRYAEAIEICRAGLKSYPREGRIYRELGWALVESNRTDEAIAAARAGAVALSSPQFMAATRHLSLPIVYETVEQLARCRTRFTNGLHQLVAETALENPTAIALALEDITPPFYLAYQGLNDVQLLRDYGTLIARIMSAITPGAADASASRPVIEKRLRIGYLFGESTGINSLFFTWMAALDPERFEVICFQVCEADDPYPAYVQAAATSFHRLPKERERISQCVVDSKVDVLVYLYIGMGSLWTQLSGLRLAPIQCATWGHPMTTGLPTVDYFISNELMEPEDADRHYSESLVRLPGIGVCPVPAYLPPLAKMRADFGLPSDSVLYLSPQAPAKYLPQYDHVFASIAARVDRALIILIQPRAPEIEAILRRRLQKAFAAEGIEYERFVRFIPRLEYDGYLDLVRECDIFLDTFEWSGGLTTLDAIKCGLPVVTCPGSLMRGRQSAGMLEQMALTETIAANAEEYVDIAVRLGTDAVFRRKVGGQLRDRQDRLFNDRRFVQALENFFSRAAEVHLNH